MGLADHPRACGEQVFPPLTVPNGSGSPPRVRGTGAVSSIRPLKNRITPARAGNSPWEEFLIALWEDHPRACGEQIQRHVMLVRPRGSPPRVRGTGTSHSLRLSCFRITPARAGNSPEAGRTKDQCKDHPRACGEQWLDLTEGPGGLGSPPRVRGTVLQRLSLYHLARITPARAGNRALNRGYEQARSDHPRACGEQGCSFDCKPPGLGSPPRVRGTGLNYYGTYPKNGITPARAGNRRLWLWGCSGQ